MGFRRWRKSKARFLFQWGPRPHRPFYVRITPDIGLSIPWFKSSHGYPRRLRIAWHHGVQIVEYRKGFWYVAKQLLGKSRVIGERRL